MNNTSKKRKNILYKKSNNRGYAIFLSVIIASLLTTVAGAIYFITKKEISYSITIKDSQYAFYVADSAADCAVYLHFKENAFSTSTPLTDTAKLKCGDYRLKKYRSNQDLQRLGGCSQTDRYGRCRNIFEFDMKVNRAEDGTLQTLDYCAVVQVLRYVDAQGYPRTRIDARGYNFSCRVKNSGQDIINPLERAVRLDL